MFCPTPRTSDGSRKSFHIHIAFSIDIVTNIGFNIGIIIRKNICGFEQPSIHAASSNSFGIVFINPWNINTASGAPNPIYANIIPWYVLSIGSPIASFIILKKETSGNITT
ncbi:hypothetical protein ABG79_02463 [Caloramator mitchellensis]|uniref:Uncharacterized protein n=1 Tax=Caloramator mitchellensis TaxID=908809 RepID=A0A0R3JXD8_CALMK|nr:hypothetical protein ABG79_02463 [Caloramator mitchellensis]